MGVMRATVSQPLREGAHGMWDDGGPLDVGRWVRSALRGRRVRIGLTPSWAARARLALPRRACPLGLARGRWLWSLLERKKLSKYSSHR